MRIISPSMKKMFVCCACVYLFIFESRNGKQTDSGIKEIQQERE